MNKLVIDKNQPIIPQLETFKKETHVVFTALSYLRDADDIKKFFTEMMDEYTEDEKSKHPDVREIIRSDICYLSNYSPSFSLGYKRFCEVLKEEFDEAMENCIKHREKKLK